MKHSTLSSSPNSGNTNVSSRFYWLRRFRFARKKIGGAWIKTKFRGWITYQTYVYYKGYGYDPIALVSEEEGVVKWQRS